MAAITSFEEIASSVPGRRIFTMTASDEDTFSPSNIVAVKARADYDVDPETGNPIGCTVSSGVVTINCTGLTAKKIILEVIGRG